MADHQHSISMREGIPKKGAAEASSADPLLALITAYRDGLAVYNAAPEAIGTDEDNAVADRTWKPSYDVLCDAPPVPTTLAGALAGVRLVVDEERSCGHQPALVVNVLKATLAFFESPKPAVPDPCLALLNDWQAAMDAAEALPDGVTDQELEEFTAAYVTPIEARIANAELPVPTTAEGAATALSKALAFVDMEDLETGLVKAALAFLEGSTGR